MTPDQAPEAEHEAAFSADHTSFELVPLVTVLGLALSVVLGAGALTETVADCTALPPGPLQLKV